MGSVFVFGPLFDKKRLPVASPWCLGLPRSEPCGDPSAFLRELPIFQVPFFPTGGRRAGVSFGEVSASKSDGFPFQKRWDHPSSLSSPRRRLNAAEGGLSGPSPPHLRKTISIKSIP